MSNDVRTSTPLTAPTEPEPRWWAAPLTGTVLAPVLAVAVSSVENTFADRTFLLTGGLLLAYALVLPSWFLARTPARRRRRNGLVLSGCVIAAWFPVLISTTGWTLFLVMLFTGHIDG
ncbi:hypothetical protein [Streptomyces sp. JH34]|uniref:hypothetical protein n=1 Tax=Streptomyces sp. JH34 TaxID=2793633 RepID=UPI0023F8EF20|nr:hypothetical protein [Streptomyces sp. JH34]MDF6018653.1 hypothetical protein [Streptomyces sp. JH34]